MKQSAQLLNLALVLALLTGLGSAPVVAVSAAEKTPPAPDAITYREPDGRSLILSMQNGNGGVSSTSTALTLGFYDSFDPAYRQYVQDWFDAVLPAITAIIGEPYQSGKICFRASGDSSQDGSCKGTITGPYPDISLPYDPSDPNDAVWDNTTTHEMIHAYHSSVMPSYCVGLSCYGHWVDEGLTEASTWLVVEYALASGLRDMTVPYLTPASYILSYDIKSLAGVEFWGGAPVPANKLNPFDAYGLVAAMFWLAATSQGSAGEDVATEDWIHYDWFRRLNEATFAWKRANPGTEMNLAQFYQFVDQVSPLLMDNQSLSAWMQAQPITHYGNLPGSYLGAFPTSFNNPTFVEILVYTLDSSQPAHESQYYGEVSGTYTVYGPLDDAVITDIFTATNGHGYIYSQDICGLGAGAYRLVFQATIGGALRTTQTAFLCALQDLTTDPAEGVGLILMDGDGTLFNGTITSGNSEVLYNATGGAIVQPEDLSTLPMMVGVGFHPAAAFNLYNPQAMLDVFIFYLPIIQCHRPAPPDDGFYNLPLPFSRIVIAALPGR